MKNEIYLENTIELFLKKQGVSQKRVDGIKKRLEKDHKKLPVCDWLMPEDGMIGLIWKRMIEQIDHQHDQFRMLRNGPVMTLVDHGDGTFGRHYTLPPGWTGEKFQKFLSVFREVLDYWFDCAVKRRLEEE